MRLATIKRNNREIVAFVTAKGLVPVEDFNKKTGSKWGTDLFTLICEEQIPELTEWYRAEGKAKLEKMNESVIPFDKVTYAPLYRNPQRIFGIGLNYKDHAGDLGENAPTGLPGSFYKPASCIVGHGDDICLPAMKEAQKTTAEAELGVIIGKKCKFIEEKDWQEYVAGYTTILDMTEESILRQNPRYLTIAKGFDTFFSFGPQFVTPDEVKDVLSLEVQSIHNGEIHAKNVVSNMTFPPSRLVALISHMQGWVPGDVLSTGTPRAFHIVDGDKAECRIYGPDGFSMEPLINPVVDLKLHPGK